MTRKNKDVVAPITRECVEAMFEHLRKQESIDERLLAKSNTGPIAIATVNLKGVKRLTLKSTE